MSLRVAIVGAGGGVGSSTAFNLLLSPAAYHVDMVESRSPMARSHEMDLQQVVAAGAAGTVRIVDLAEIAAADIVVISASTPLTVNESRLVYLRDNAEILETVVDALPAGWPGILLVVTNPVDALVTWLVERYGLDRRRVLGYTANDSLRLRTAVGSLLGVASGRVDAWVLGEHGDRSVPLLDRVTVDGAAVTLTAAQREEAVAFVRGWYVEHVALDSGRSSTWTSGLGIARMVEALRAGAPEPWPAAVRLDGEYGIAGAAVTVPVALGPGGAEHVLEWDLGADERAALRDAAGGVSASASSLSAARP